MDLISWVECGNDDFSGSFRSCKRTALEHGQRSIDQNYDVLRNRCCSFDVPWSKNKTNKLGHKKDKAVRFLQIQDMNFLSTMITVLYIVVS